LFLTQLFLLASFMTKHFLKVAAMAAALEVLLLESSMGRK
jgi:hypothetical protein